MSRKITIDPTTFIQTIKPMNKPSEIEQLCAQHFGNVENCGISPKSFANRLGAYTKLIKTIPQSELVLNQNAIEIDGRLTHLFMHFTGLAHINWKDINQKADERKIDDFVDRNPIDVVKYFEVLEKLINPNSNDAELALGLIAVSGRRPIEILYEAQFELIDFSKINEKDSIGYRDGYHIFFKNQVKKRDYDKEERVDYPIGLLVNSDYFLYAFRKFRNSDLGKGIKELALRMQNQGFSVEEIHNKIHDNIAKKVRRVCEKSFTFVNSLDATTRNETASPKDLRAIYIRLLMERDRPKKFSEPYFAGVHLGHIQNTGGKTKNLRNLANTVRYDQYFIESDDVPLLNLKVPQALRTPKMPPEHKQALKEYQQANKLPNQGEAIADLAKSSKEILDLKETIRKQLEQLEDMNVLRQKVAQLQAENDQLKEQLKEQSKDEKSSVYLGKINLPKEPENMTNEELWQTRADGCSEVKLTRTIEAIKLYNDTLATGDIDTPKIAITNQLVRAISGTNPTAVGEFLNLHSDEIISHHCKHELQNEKDPTKLTTYANKKLGSEKIKEVTKLIVSNFLKGVSID